MDKKNNLEQKKRSLEEKIERAKFCKKDVAKKVQELINQYDLGNLSYQEYEALIEEAFGKRKPQEWLDYYDSYIKECQNSVKLVEKEIVKARVKSLAIKIVPIIFLSLVFVLILIKVFTGFNILGLTIGEDEESSKETTPAEEGAGEAPPEETTPAEEPQEEIPPESPPEETTPEEPVIPEENATLPEEETNVTMPEEETNITLPEENVTVSNETEGNVTLPETNVTMPEENVPAIQNATNETIISNATNVTIPELNLTNFTQAPILIKEILNIEIIVNGSYNITLTDYFALAEEYKVDKVDNISFILTNDSLEIIPDLNFIGNRTTKIAAENRFGSNESNEFNINVVEGYERVDISANVTTLQYKAIINKPVKWIKIVNTSNENGELKIDLPKEANNISVKTGEEINLALRKLEDYEALVGNTDKQDLVSGTITGNVAFDLDKKKGIITRLFEWFKGIFRRGITGKAIQEEALQEQITETSDKKTVDVTEIFDQTNASEIAVEYYTEGPKSVEESLANGKRVIVSGRDELNLTDILAFVEIPEVNKAGEEGKIKIYWRENESLVNFSVGDLDNNGKIDYVEWIVPHLSNQTFDIILITKAEHLDSNRSFISDIYEQVKELDGNWSEAIGNGEYIRVSFEVPLDKTRDITVYVRPTNISGECYDNQTQIFTESGWKYFYQLNKTEKVATLNKKTSEIQWQNPIGYSEYDNSKLNGEMYKIKTIDENGKEGNLVVSEKHKVYSKSIPNDLSSSTSSLVLNTSTNVCLLKCTSLDQIGIDLESAKAKYTVSSLSGIDEFACFRKETKDFFGTNDIFSFINMNNSSISSDDKELNSRILGLCSFISWSNCIGENNFNFSKNKIFLVMPIPVSPVNTIPASITSSIYFNEGYSFFNFSCIDLLTSLANSSASFSENLDLETNSWNLSYPWVNSILFANASLATSDQLITLNESIFFFNSSGIDIVKCSILNLSCASKTQKTQKTQIFKDFGLNPVEEVYSDFNSGKEIYFLDEFGKNVKITSISKENYSGKIYDVDVANDIVLVKRENGSAVWSGNSNPNYAQIGVYSKDDDNEIARFGNISEEGYYKIYLTNLSELANYSQDTFDLRVLGGSLEFDHIIDPTMVPYTILNTPANASTFRVGIFDIKLNATIIDPDANTTNVFFYGVNSSNTGNFYKHGLLYQQLAVSNNTQVTYNWTSPAIVPDALTVVLYHLDNNSKFGENQTKVYDFVSGNVNLTAVGNAYPNMTWGKFAGGWVFDGNGDYLNDASNVGALNGNMFQGTFSAWVKRAGNSANGYETIIQEGNNANGYVLTANCNGDGMIQAATKDTGGALSVETSNSILADGNWHLLTAIFDMENTMQYIYVDGVLNNSGYGAFPSDPNKGVRVGGHTSGIGQNSVCDAAAAAGSFNGTIDEATIWNRTLSASEIMDLYRLNVGKYYWKVNITDQDNNNNESETREFTLNPQNLPYTVLNGPANASVFYLGIYNITLNASVFDLDNDTINFQIYGLDSTSTGSLYNLGVLNQSNNVSNGTQIVYNWTEGLFIPGYNEELLAEALYHLDNNSIFGENDTNIVDFYTADGQALNLTPVGNAFPNMTGGKFGGAWQFDGDGDFLNSTSNLIGGADIVTFSAWVKRAGNSSTGYETIIQDNVLVSGYSLTANCNNSLLQFVIRGSSVAKASTSNSIISDGQWHLVTGVYSMDLQNISLYVDGIVKASTSTTASNDASNDPHKFVIGGNPSGTYSSTSGGTSCDASANAGSFNGSIDDVYVLADNINNYINISNMYKLKKGKYSWKVNVTDSIGGNNESETREFVVRDTSYVLVNSAMNCTDLLTEATTYYYGYSCSAAGYSTCVGLNADLNITSSGRLNVPSSCNIQFNQSSNGQYNFIIEGTGKLNLTGNITSASSDKFNFKPYVNLPTISGNNGSMSFFNVSNSLNLSDSKINFYNLTISSNMAILNSTDITTGTYSIASGGRLDRQWRLNVSVYASGAVVSGANVTARNVSLAVINSKLTGSNGAAWLNLSEYVDTGSGKINQNNYTINVSSGGYVPSSTTINLTSDNSTSVTLTTYSVIQVSSTETLHDIFTRINDPVVFVNLSSASRPCRYAATASINITTGNLVMENCTLEMNNTDAKGGSGIFDLIVGGGILTANYSNITRSSENFNYDFYTASTAATQVILKNSFVSYGGSSSSVDNRRGLSINTNNVTFINNTLISQHTANLEIGANGLLIQQSSFLGASQTPSYNLFIRANDSIILDSNLSGAVTNDIRLSTRTNIILLNTNHTDESLQSGSVNNSLFKKWYLDIKVINGSGSGINSVNVTFYNVSGAITQSSLTNSSGDIVRQNVTEFISNGTTRNYWTNYNITALKVDGINKTINVNITQSANYTINPSPSVPSITYVTSIGSVNPLQADVRNINFNFTIQHGDGGEIINITSAKANFTSGTESIRANNSCSLLTNENTSTTRNFTCTIGMWYFDNAATWNVSIYVSDNNGNATTNLTTFIYGTSQDFVVSLTLLNFGTISPIATNKTPTNTPWLMNNTGNYNVVNVSLLAINLYGESVTTEFLGAGNFTASNNTGGSPPLECSGNALVNGTEVNITGVSLPRGNNSLAYNNETSGQEQLYLCLKQVPSGISQQVYSTLYSGGAGAWTIRISLAVFAIEGVDRLRRKRKKKVQLENNGKERLFELDEENILEILDKKLKERYDLGLDDILVAAKRKVPRKLIKKEEIKIPLEVFKQKIGAAESICKYLKENKGIKFSEIAHIVGRDQRTIWNNYRNAVNKMKDKIEISKESMFVPKEIFSNKKLSILESVIYYLREKGYRNLEIAKMLGKDARNVWTIYSRARKKTIS